MQDALKCFFISYDSADQEWAEWIKFSLEDAGYSTMLSGDVPPGFNFVLKNSKACAEADHIIVILSPDYLNSPIAQAEWAVAYNRDPNGGQGILIPVCVRECKHQLSGLLGSIAYIDLVGKNEEEALKTLVTGISKEGIKRQMPPTFPGIALAPLAADPDFPSDSLPIWYIPYQRNSFFTGRETILEFIHDMLFKKRDQKIMNDLKSIDQVDTEKRSNSAFGPGQTHADLVVHKRIKNDNNSKRSKDIGRLSERKPLAGEASFSESHNDPYQTRSKYLSDRPYITAITQAISGLGGIGKTQVAIEYAYRYCDDYHDLLWIRADSHEVLVADFVSIAKELNLPEKDIQDQSKVIGAVKGWLNKRINWLLIFDNADNPEIIYDYLPSSKSGHILITTRRQSLGEVASSIEIDTMSLEEGALFLLRRANLIPSDALLTEASTADCVQAKEISELMGGLPLALDQAGAYIVETQCGLLGYLGLYKARGAELLKRRGGFGRNYLQPVSTTWSLSIEKVQQSCLAAVEILHLCAFLYPDSIPLEIITKGAPDLGLILQSVAADPLLLDQAIEELLKYSLIRRNSSDQTLTLHRLVQAVLKDGMSEDTQQLWAERAVRAVNRAFPDVEFSSWPQCQRYILHAQICATIIKQWDMKFVEASRLLSQSGIYLRERAQYTEAEQHCSLSLIIREQILGEKHPDVINSRNDLALLYRAQGKHNRAEKLFRRILSIQEQTLGQEHRDVAETLNNLGLLYHDQGKYDRAEPFHQQAVAIWEKVLGPNHPNVARGLNNVAIFHYVQRNYVQAEPLFIRARAIYESIYGFNHPNVASIVTNLGLLYYAQSKYPQAEALFIQAQEIYERTLGLMHPSIAPVLCNLAILYSDQDQYHQAEPLYLKAISIYEQTFGLEHPPLIQRLRDLAEIYYVQDKYDKAEPLFTRVQAIYTQVYGESHPDTIACVSRLAYIHSEWNTHILNDSKLLSARIQKFLESVRWD